jgi:hypothetical protein
MKNIITKLYDLSHQAITLFGHMLPLLEKIHTTELQKLADKKNQLNSLTDQANALQLTLLDLNKNKTHLAHLQDGADKELQQKSLTDEFNQTTLQLLAIQHDISALNNSWQLSHKYKKLFIYPLTSLLEDANISIGLAKADLSILFALDSHTSHTQPMLLKQGLTNYLSLITRLHKTRQSLQPIVQQHVKVASLLEHFDRHLDFYNLFFRNVNNQSSFSVLEFNSIKTVLDLIIQDSVAQSEIEAKQSSENLSAKIFNHLAIKQDCLEEKLLLILLETVDHSHSPNTNAFLIYTMHMLHKELEMGQHLQENHPFKFEKDKHLARFFSHPLACIDHKTDADIDHSKLKQHGV